MSKYVIDSTTLVAIGDAVREKEGTTAPIAVNQLASRISAIETGGGSADIPEEAFTITGDCQYAFTHNRFKWFVEGYGSKVNCNITNAYYMFHNSTELEKIPFDITLDMNNSTVGGTTPTASMFNKCQSLKAVPNLIAKNGVLRKMPTGQYSGTMNAGDMFKDCRQLKEIPYDYLDRLCVEGFIDKRKEFKMNGSTSQFQNCYSLRNLPNLKWWANYGSNGYYYSMYQYGFQNCYSLDEAVNIPVETPAYTSGNVFTSMVGGCYRLKRLTFETNEDGTPIAVGWKSQTLDLSYSGYANQTTANAIASDKYNNGITADKVISNDATYQALKDDEDAVAIGKEYSRYNHDSAVETINSLPDCSSGGGNVIRFITAQGANTDGGAIGNLTEEEIAVATAKGWTVTLAES